MRFFKKKQQIFGAKIEPDCLYCRYNSGEKDIICRFGSSPCKKYSYDPTKREPKAKPPLKSYNEDDFSL